MQRFHFLFLLFLLPILSAGQTNTDFWFAAPEVTSGHGDQPIYFRLTSFGQTANVTISEPANPLNFPTQNITIPANQTRTVTLTPWKEQIECKPPNQVLNFGLYIHSTVPITAYYEEANLYNPELFTLKGNNAMGTSFFIPSQDNLKNHAGLNPPAYSSFDIVASVDATSVTIKPKKPIVGHAAGSTFQVMLNKGQVYSARAMGQQGADHLMGSTVTSDKPVAITLKDDSDDDFLSKNWDLTGDQIVPLNIIGTEYIVVRGYTNSSMNDWVYITATVDNTKIYLNGSSSPAATKNSGETYQYNLLTNDLSSFIRADQPVYVLHLTGYGAEVGSALLPPMDCTGSSQVAFTRSSPYSFELIILTKADAQGWFVLDGNPNLVTATMFSPVAGNPAFVYARIEFPAGTLPVGAHILTNSKNIFHMGVIQTYDAGKSGCSYGYFSDFASLNLGPDKTVCAGVSVTFDAGPNRQSYKWFYNGTLYMTGVQKITVSNPGVYSVTVDDHGCELSDQVRLDNYRVPKPNIIGVTDFCIGNSQQLSVQATYSSYLWTTGATTRSIMVSSSGTYGVTVTDNNGCAGSSSVVVTVHPVPHLTNNPASKAICSSDNTNISLISDVTGTLFTWTSTVTSGSVTGNNNSTQPGVLINDQLVNNGITDGVVKYSITPHTNGCDGPVVDYLVKVHPTPHLTNSTTTMAFCSPNNTNIILTFDVTGTLFSWTSVVISGSVTGNSNSAQPGLLINDHLTNNGTSDGIVKYSITPHANNCNGPVVDYFVTVHPIPHLTNNPTSKPICSSTNTNISLTSDVAGTLFTWTSIVTSGSVTGNSNSAQPGSQINDLLVNNGITDGVVKYSITPHNSCDGPVVDYFVTVHPTPHLTNSTTTKAICSPNNTNISLTFDVAGTLFTWTSIVTSGSVTGNSNSAQPGLLINDQLVNTGNIDGIVKYSITPHANSCNGPVVDYSVTVHPLALVNTINPQSICSGAQTLAVPLSSNVTTLTVNYVWTVSCDPGIPACPGSGSTSTIPAVTISNNDLVPRYANYIITPSVAGCQGTPLLSYKVQVNPSPTVTTSSLSQQICSGSSSTLVVLTSNVSGTTFGWMAYPSSTAITGYQLTPGTGNIIPQTISNSSLDQGFVNYHIIPYFQSGTSCTGAAIDYKIYVNPLPTPSITGQQQVCQDQKGTVYSTPFVEGHDYIWTVTGGVTFTGNHTNSITVDWGPGPAGTVQLTEIDKNYPTNCSTTIPVNNIIINPAPIPVITGEANPCGQTIQLYTIGAQQANHTSDWTVTGGTPTSLGNSSSISVTWGNANPVSLDVLETITYAQGVTCKAHAPSFPITLTLIPDAAAAISGISAICQGLTSAFSVDPILNSDSYNWWYEPSTGVTITNSGSSANLFFDFTSVSGFLYVQGQKTGCASGPASPAHSITVNISPLVTLQSCNDLVTSRGAKPFLLKGGIPLDGVYAIDGNILPTPPILDPSTLNPSPPDHTITYTYTNHFGCAVIKTQSLKVNSASGFICKNILTDIRDGKKYPTFEVVTGITHRCWMSANLNYGSFIRGNTAQTDNCSIEKYCEGDDAVKCTESGALYQWDELMNYVPADVASAEGKQGFCPPEWHVPTEADWTMLENYYLGPGLAGWTLLDPYPLYGFHATTRGIFYQNLVWAFSPPGFSATLFWTSTVSPSDNTKIISHGLNDINPSVSKYFSTRGNALPVRCVKD